MIAELSHRIVDGMITYPGVPAPRLSVHLSREDSRKVYAPGTDAYFHGHPYLAPESAAWLADQGAALVGIDSLNIDDTPPHGERPAHSILLKAGIPLVEHLTGLAALPGEGFRFHAAPPMVAGMGTFPVRAYAIVP
ncbi:cyclase family protein [Nonomuraea sp. M3C6]|uniref:Cyclase family protein n=1 Tax=Nonomuraea marmarensis TaxID=3351344 RepID=A0ABW7A2S2_9ACTN